MRKHVAALATLLAVSFASAFASAGLADVPKSDGKQPSAPATAPTDCPPGSQGKVEDKFSWCEPTVCEDDTTCGGGKVCRMIGLCVEVGTIDASTGAKLEKPAGAENKLVTVGRCAAEKKCPESTVCSEHKRCVDRATADRMGILDTAPSASPSASAGAGDGTRKSACGCDAPGAKTSGTGAIMLSMIALGVLARRRRAPAKMPQIAAQNAQHQSTNV